MLEQIGQDLLNLVGVDLLNLLAGIGILFVGWLIALVLSAVVYNLLKRAKLNDRLVGMAGAEGEKARMLKSGYPAASSTSFCCLYWWHSCRSSSCRRWPSR
jgi:hypothetical protein